MNCKAAERHILLQSAGEISISNARKLNLHLEQCQHCMEFAASLTMFQKMTSGNIIDAPDPLIAKTLHAASKITLHTAPFRRHFQVSLLRIAATLILALGLWLSIRNVIFNSTTSHLPPDTRLMDISNIIFAVTGSELWPDQAKGAQSTGVNIEDLAQQILISQGMYVDFSEDLGESFNLPEELQPTTLLWNNIPAIHSEICG
jgi:hypothetical protein